MRADAIRARAVSRRVRETHPRAYARSRNQPAGYPPHKRPVSAHGKRPSRGALPHATLASAGPADAPRGTSTRCPRESATGGGILLEPRRRANRAPDLLRGASRTAGRNNHCMARIPNRRPGGCQGNIIGRGKRAHRNFLQMGGTARGAVRVRAKARTQRTWRDTRLSRDSVAPALCWATGTAQRAVPTREQPSRKNEMRAPGGWGEISRLDVRRAGVKLTP